jgi:hypothetical protein
VPPRAKTPAPAVGIHAHDTFKLGRRPKTPDRRDLQFAKLIDKSAFAGVKLPGHLAYQDKVTSYPMLGNDRVGDCTMAAKYHMIQTWDAVVGEVTFAPTDGMALGDYSRVTGYNPRDPNTDQGAVERDVLNDWRSVNAADGQRIYAFAAVDFKDEAQVKFATYLFGGVYWGISLPETAQDQSQAGGTWKKPTRITGQGAPGSWGGHAAPSTGYDRHGVPLITWGFEMHMAWAFIREYVEECWALVPREWFAASGIDPTGLNEAKLEQYLASLSG